MTSRWLLTVLAGLTLMTAFPAVHAEQESTSVVELVDEEAPPVEPKRIYKRYDKDGNAVFSDESAPGAEELQVMEPNSVNLKQPVIAPAPQESSKPVVTFHVRITKPKNDTHFHNHYEPVPVAVAVTPGLGKLYTLEVTDNGAPVPQTEGQHVIPLLDRGEHTLLARVLDKEGKEVSVSEPVIIYVHRASAKN